MLVKFKRLHPAAKIPRYQTPGAAGMDLSAIGDNIIAAHSLGIVGTGLAMQLPVGWEAQIRPRSGLARNYRVTVLNSPATIDSDYTGEVMVLLFNHYNAPFEIKEGDRIAQMLVVPAPQVDIQEVDELDETERGSSGFGSTGTK